MGIYKYLSYIFRNYKPCLSGSKTAEYILIDGNCLLHQALEELAHDLNVSELERMDKMITIFKDTLQLFNFRRCVICIDGMASLSKKLCQKERRNRTSDVYSIELLPGTKLMQYLDDRLTKEFQGVTIIPSTIAGEGEHKIINYMKLNCIEDAIIVTADSDLIILSLLNLKKTLVYYTSKYLSVDIDMLRDTMRKRGLYNSLLEIVVCCGNDYLPKALPEFEIEDIEKIFRDTKSEIDFSIDVFLKRLEVFQIKKTCKCTPKVIMDYLYIVKWFVTLYSTGVEYEGLVYENSDIPCASCLNSYKDYYRTLELRTKTIETEEEYALSVLPENLTEYKASYCK